MSMDFLNEEGHIPDKINVSIMINYLTDQLISQLSSRLKKGVYDSGYSEENRKIFPTTIEIYAGSVNNPCASWLCDDALFSFHINAGDYFSKVKGEYIEDSGVVLRKNLDKLGTGKLASAKFEYYFTIDIISRINSRLYDHSTMKELKASLRHEIEHAYKDLKIKEDEAIKLEAAKESQDTNQINKKEELYTAYFKMKAAREENMSHTGGRNLKGLFYDLMYYLNHMEFDAYLSSFYQEILNDIEFNKSVKPITDYKTFSLYNGLLESLIMMKEHKNDNYVNMFKELNSYISDIFGEKYSCVDKNVEYRYDRFVKKMAELIESFIKRCSDIYKRIMNYEYKFVTNAEVEDAYNSYMARFFEFCKRLSETYSDGYYPQEHEFVRRIKLIFGERPY